MTPYIAERKSKPGVRCPRKIFIQAVYIDGESIPLKNKIWLSCSYDKEGGQYLAEVPELNIFDFSHDLQLAITSIKEQIGTIWQAYVDVDISKLTMDAAKFRAKISEMVVFE